MEQKKHWLYPPIKGLVRLFYGKMTVVGAENLPDGAAVVVGNHTQMNGPIACELFFPGLRYTWCAGQMMELKEVPDYAYADFWWEKPRWTKWFYRLASYAIAPVSVIVFNSANTIPVYRDTRIIKTFKQTVARLQEGARVVVFPEEAVDYNNILCRFQDKFIDIARMYYKRSGEEVAFVPLYIAPALRTMYIGKPTRFRADVPMEEERERICRYLMDEITAMARSLPRHKVVPYRNLPKKQYRYNVEEASCENTRG